jgi:hypothetical protein
LQVRIDGARGSGAAPVEARLYDVSGRLKARIAFASSETGASIDLDSVDLSPGVVFVEVRMSDGSRAGRKVAVLR